MNSLTDRHRQSDSFVMRLLQLSYEEHNRVQKLELKILEELDRVCVKHDIRYSIAYGSLIGAIRHNGFIPWDDDIDVCMPRRDYVKFKQICKKELGEDFFYQSNDTDKEYFYLFDKLRLNNTVFRESFVSKYHIHHGIYIDIFPIDNIPDERWKKSLQFYLFHFCRTGVQSKYLMLGARSGKKRVAATVLRLLYAPFPLRWLYKRAHQVATRYNSENCKKAGCFFSPYKKKDIFPIDTFNQYERHQFESIQVNVVKDWNLMLTGLYGDYRQLPPEEKRKTVHTVTELKL